MRCVSSPAENLKTAIRLTRDAAKKGAKVVCLPELFLSEYFCQSEDHDYFKLAEVIPGPTTETLGKLAKELGVVIIASLFERRAPGLYHNTTAIIEADGKYLGKYRKMHIPDDPLFYEKFYFTPGDLGFKNWKTSAGDLGVLICWDQWYPEAARLTALQGSEVLFYPTAIGWHPSEKKQYGANQKAAWQLARGRMPWPTDAMSAESTVSGTSPPPGAMDLNSGVAPSWLLQMDRSSRKPRRTRRPSSLSNSIANSWIRSGRTGLSFEIDASMPIRGLRSAFSIEENGHQQCVTSR